MNILIIERMSLLVRITLAVSNRCSFTYRHRKDIELGLQSFRSAPASLEAPEREEDMNSSAPSANQVGEVADSEPTSVSVSVQRLELQPTLPTPVDAETSLSPNLVQEAWIDSNGFPRVPIENTQPALTDMEGRELRPAAEDQL